MSNISILRDKLVVLKNSIASNLASMKNILTEKDSTFIASNVTSLSGINTTLTSYTNIKYYPQLRGEITIKVTSLTAITETIANICYGNGIYVAKLAGYAYVYTSLNGINWTKRAMSYASAGHGICYGNGIFVMITYLSYTSMVSTNGITWSTYNMGFSSSWSDICFGNGVFVVVGTTYIMLSKDGKGWCQLVAPSAYTWTSIAFGNNIFIATATGVSVVALSTDNGITWTTGSINTVDYWTSICFGNGIFVAVAAATGRISTSKDGITWTERSISPYSIGTTFNVVYGNGLFIAVSSDDMPYMVTSLDGITWVVVINTLPANTITAFGEDMFINVSPNMESITTIAYTDIQADTNDVISNKLFINRDSKHNSSKAFGTLGSSMISKLYPAPVVGNWNMIAYGNGKFVALTANVGYAIISNDDGITWIPYVLPSISYWQCITYGSGKFVAVAMGNIIITSTDGMTWVQSTITYSLSWASIAYYNNVYILSVVDTASYLKSTDLVTWTQITTPNSTIFTKIKTVNNLFIGIPKVESDLHYSTSQDGIVWTTNTVTITGSWLDIAYGNGIYVVLLGYVILYSYDAITWNSLSLSAIFEGYAYNIAFGNGRFILITSSATVHKIGTSVDGIHWSPINFNAALVLNDLAYNANTMNFVMTSNTSTMFRLFTNRSSSNAVEGSVIVAANTSINVNIGFRPARVYALARGLATSNKRLYHIEIFDDLIDSGDLIHVNGADYSNINIRDNGNLANSLLDTSVDQKILDIGFRITNETANELTFDYTAIKINNGTLSTILNDYRFISSARVLPLSGQYIDIIYANNVYVVLLYNQNTILTSNTGKTWVEHTAPELGSNWLFTLYTNNVFLAVSENMGMFATSIDNGVTWVYDGSTDTSILRSDGAVRDNSFIITTTDIYIKVWYNHTTWYDITGFLSGKKFICYGNGMLIIICQNASSYQYYTSIDADCSIWTTRVLPILALWSNIIYGNGMFIAISNSNIYITSPDGITWTERVLPSTASWYDIKYGNGVFMIIAKDTSSILTSIDGIIWRDYTITLNNGVLRYTLCYGNNEWLIPEAVSTKLNVINIYR